MEAEDYFSDFPPFEYPSADELRGEELPGDAFREEEPVRDGAARQKKKRQKPVTLISRAVGFLSRREYSKKELYAKLRRYALEEGKTEDDALEAVEKLERLGYLSNERFAEQYLRAKSAKFGNRRLAEELKNRGLGSDEIAQALGGVPENEEDRAYAVWRRKFSEYPDSEKERARQIRFLMYRGFSYSVVSAVLARVKRGEDE